MTELHCTVCGYELTGGLDTFGSIANPVCLSCHYQYCERDDCCDSWYGLGPHKHDMSITGSIIGSTVLYPLDEYERDGNWYCIDKSNDLYFMPDPEAPGLGIWEMR